MTIMTNGERLEDRARDLEAKGLNGFRLVYVTLEAAPKPTFALLDVEFRNGNALAPLPPKEAFAIRGGGPSKQVSVVQVLAGPGRTLRLKLAPVGDYSTYVLTTTAKGIAAPGNALPLTMDPLLNSQPFKFRPGCFNLNCAPDWVAPPPPPVEPVIDTLARDYDSFRHVLITAMAKRVPGWATTSEADLDQVLIDLIAADADEQADFHDRVLAERSIATARKRVSLARHARLMDYHIHQGNQASTWLALNVGGVVDLPSTSAGEFGVWNGKRWQDPGAVIFAIPREGARWRGRCYPSLNELRLYTWRDTVTALATGSIEADLTGTAPLAKVQAEALRDLFLGDHPDQGTTHATADVATAVDHLLIEEVLNPETGAPNGRDPRRRQVVRLVAAGGLPPRAEALQDPLTAEWFVRVRWRMEDALTQNFCFIADCGGTLVRDAAKFTANLVTVTQGRPRETTFHPPDAAVGGLDEHDLLATDEANYVIVDRQVGPDRPLRAVLCPLTRAPLAYRATPPGGERPIRSTLEVEVLGFASPWQERSDLIESEGDDEHFIVETDELGASVVRFGDGTNGARVPQKATIACRYRVGQGTAGNVGADALTGFAATGGIVTRVLNPFDVADGRDPEPVREIIRRAPEAYRERQLRAVTLGDYARRAEELSGVAHARARYGWTGSWRTVRVAIDPEGTTVLDEPLRRSIADHLEAVRLIGEDLEVRPAQYVPLDVKLRVCAHPHYWPEDLRAVLEMEFSDGWTPDGRRGFFHPDAWTFGQTLCASQLIGRALAVTGVERVLRISVRRWNPGAGGAIGSIDIDPSALPESMAEQLAVGAFEIIVVANDPDRLESGRIVFEIEGGRR